MSEIQQNGDERHKFSRHLPTPLSSRLRSAFSINRSSLSVFITGSFVYNEKAHVRHMFSGKSLQRHLHFSVWKAHLHWNWQCLNYHSCFIKTVVQYFPQKWLTKHAHMYPLCRISQTVLHIRTPTINRKLLQSLRGCFRSWAINVNRHIVIAHLISWLPYFFPEYLVTFVTPANET